MISKKQKSRSDAKCLHLKAINKRKQLVVLSKMVQDMEHASIVDVLIAQVNISNEVPAFRCQLLLQNTSFMSLVTKLISAIIK